ncbi:MAG: fasciclin domain-containing protein [Chromatiaceae bacterium]|nr:MAG: fasciclin domain-containing protein [Chromatiaceae bacterium]
MSYHHARWLRRTALVALVAAALIPNLAMSVDSRGQDPGVSGWARTLGLTPGVLPGTGAPNGASGMLSDVLGRRLPSPTERALSVEFFSSLLRAVSYGAMPSFDGAYTLFLPVDGAFSRRSGAELDALVHNPGALQALVGAHLVAGRVTAADLQAGAALQSLNGQPIAAERADQLQVNGATVIGTVELDNGIVHYIDRLL